MVEVYSVAHGATLSLSIHLYSVLDRLCVVGSVNSAMINMGMWLFFGMLLGIF